MIDLRSDTVTKPSIEMRKAMETAEVGDDVYGEDPTINELQGRMAKMFNKESALFFPSGTMCNLAAILSWCPERGSEIIVGDRSHILLFEQTNSCQFGGISLRAVPNLRDGTMNLENISAMIRDDDIHEPRTKLICIENTHNVCGGRIIPISFMKELYEFSKKNGIPIHLDGARIWNALTESNDIPSTIGQYTDSLSVCLSKGLGAPVGSVLIGSHELISKAKRVRKALGGGLRQSGILAAAGIVALNDFISGILEPDHERAKQLAIEIEKLPIFNICNIVETNILFFEIVPSKIEQFGKKIYLDFVHYLKEKQILITLWSPNLFRIVIHRDISEEDINKVIYEIRYFVSIQL